MPPPLLSFAEVSKRFSPRGAVPKLALDRLSMEVQAGEIVGFLGPNGAGKTTALHLALGFLKPSAGSGALLGLPFGSAKARSGLGFVPDQPVFFPGNAANAVRQAAILSGSTLPSSAIRQALEEVGLGDARGDVRKFSRGMQQRLALAQAIAYRPRLFLLDEPTSGLDPSGTLAVLALLRRMRDEGAAVLLSSHQLEIVSSIVDRILLLNHGQEVLRGTPTELLRGNGDFELTFTNLPQALRPPVTVVKSDEVRTTLRCAAPAQRQVVEQAWAAGATLESVERVQETLTELFLRMTGPTKDVEDRVA